MRWHVVPSDIKILLDMADSITKCDNFKPKNSEMWYSGFLLPPRSEKPMKYTHLTENERYMLSALRKQGLAVAAIAKALGRHRSTVYREVERNSRWCNYDQLYSYQPARAQQKVRVRTKKAWIHESVGWSKKRAYPLKPSQQTTALNLTNISS